MEKESQQDLLNGHEVNGVLPTEISEESMTQNGIAADSPTNLDLPQPMKTNAVIETVKENLKKQSLTPDQVTTYCKKIFRFKEIRVMRFKYDDLLMSFGSD